MPGNFYSETPADELRRVKAEFSRERALCATLGDVLGKATGMLRDFIHSCGADDDDRGLLAECEAALSELEKQA